MNTSMFRGHVARMGRETFYRVFWLGNMKEVFKPTIGNGSLHQDSNDNGVRKVTLDT